MTQAPVAGTLPLLVFALLLGCSREPGISPEAPVATARGEQLFKERCAPCHPEGGNSINPKKTLHARVLADHGITSPGEIVAVMRDPGPGMARFDRESIPDGDALLIADYVLATFR